MQLTLRPFSMIDTNNIITVPQTNIAVVTGFNTFLLLSYHPVVAPFAPAIGLLTSLLFTYAFSQGYR